MCTLSISPLSEANSFVLTSNRDEAPQRGTLVPSFYTEEEVKMAFPKDLEAGGTWLGVSERKRTVTLLNGGFVNHLRKPPYSKSRGVVVKDFLKAPIFAEIAENYDLKGVEPFTMIIADWQKELFFAEFVWDGQMRYLKYLPLQPHIWSSSPLYTSEMKQLREKWFKNFLSTQKRYPEDFLDFHLSAGKDDKTSGVIMDREFVKTRSVSQIILRKGEIDFLYKDLAAKEVSKMTFLDTFF